MENLEEVLQALDEFQKMRPTEIPRELEDYLCWVAKTGDPVYQWSLIKTLFREKLTRVMTDFYESCPSLELAPCPNVEHFNYDTMKSNLLERLESFANAPFTVQRICELLTAPRKEYNRVDKFMRAIEKNILVVSTREPGPIARRSENGDGMVNGSVEEDATSVTQPAQDVEMEYWEKDCGSTVTISVHTVENETPLMQTAVPTATTTTTTVVKNAFSTEEGQEKLEQGRADVAVSSFVPSTSEFTGVTNLTSQVQSQEPTITPVLQNMPTITQEASGIVGDVPEAIMNEDTSSQPSLDLENEESETAESTRKLQTTFQAKDFTSSDKSKFYMENTNANEKDRPVISAQEVNGKENELLVKQQSPEPKQQLDSKPAEAPLKNDAEKADTGSTVIEGTVIDNDAGKNIIVSTEECTSTFLPAQEETTRLTESGINSEETSDDAKNSRQQIEDTLNPIIEEPASKDNGKQEESCAEKDELTITEAVDTEDRGAKSIVPDPVPIIEEPKEEAERSEDSSDAVEISEEQTGDAKSSENEKSMENENLEELNDKDVTSKDSESIGQKEISVEMMEVDEEMPMFQQDEPMEQETAELSKS